MNKGKNRKDQRTVDIINSYKNVFGTEEGKLVLYDLLSKGHFLRPTFDRNGDSASLRNEGQRELCLHILEKIQMDIGRVLQLVETEQTIEQEYFN